VATPKEMADYFEEVYPLERFSPSSFRLIAPISGCASDVFVRIRPLGDDDPPTEWSLVVSSPVAKNDLPLAEVMEACSFSPFGIREENGFFILRNVLPIDEIDENQIIDSVVGYLATYAEEIVSRLQSDVQGYDGSERYNKDQYDQIDASTYFDNESDEVVFVLSEEEKEQIRTVLGKKKKSR